MCTNLSIVHCTMCSCMHIFNASCVFILFKHFFETHSSFFFLSFVPVCVWVSGMIREVKVKQHEQSGSAQEIGADQQSCPSSWGPAHQSASPAEQWLQGKHHRPEISAATNTGDKPLRKFSQTHTYSQQMYCSTLQHAHTHSLLASNVRHWLNTLDKVT